MNENYVGLETVQYLKKSHLNATKRLKKAEKDHSKLREGSSLHYASLSERRIAMLQEEISSLEVEMVKSWK